MVNIRVSEEDLLHEMRADLFVLVQGPLEIFLAPFDAPVNYFFVRFLVLVLLHLRNILKLEGRIVESKVRISVDSEKHSVRL